MARVVVIGGGNAAFCAALSAQENGADVIVLERHKLIHTGAKPFECPHCEYAARQKPHLTRHIRRKHSDEEPDKQCPHCEYAAWTSIL